MQFVVLHFCNQLRLNKNKMVEQAQMFSAEQVDAFVKIVALLVLVNAGSIVSNLFNYLFKNYKMRKDLNEAFRRIRELEKTKQENTDESICPTLPK